MVVVMATSRVESISDRAALMRDESGEIVGTTAGDTQCWFPREPSKLVSIGDDGRETIIRCRFCLGCRELERRILARRLVETYREETRDLWLVSIQCPIEDQAALASRLKRTRMVRFSSAFYRLGSNSVALIAVGEKPTLSALRALRLYGASCVKIRKTRGARAFSALTIGILRRRDEFGRWLNRYYHRGLKPRERAIAFTRATRYTRGIGKRHSLGKHQHSVRAWKDGVSIHMPDAVKVPRLRRRKGPIETRAAGGLSRVEALVTGTSRALSMLSPATKSRPMVLARERHPHNLDQRKRVLNSLERYSGSRQLDKSDFGAWAERMAEIARKRGRDDDG